MKTHKGISRRIKVTGTGKLLHKRAGKRHLMSKKSGKRRRRLSKWQQLPPGEVKKLKRQFNFG